ncbi:hypothetical protein [Sphingomonas abietis]|uniref:Type II toxin-antitoxin system HicA family toxin n=1 Tax=Sphingomonas abietis TaxID=3012344 RepID=A0ABY7NKK8_9SPHN|nr:hypothetical protein [Sphingomonas abietis]WBO22024.1 hypothetical protein PBT88_17970 [Sphingomonas abietis]
MAGLLDRAQPPGESRVIHFMVTQGWKSLTDVAPPQDGRLRIVSPPIEHLGVRNALRGAFPCSDAPPTDFDRLLAKLR